MECPRCHWKDAYGGLLVVECRNPNCANYNSKHAQTCPLCDGKDCPGFEAMSDCEPPRWKHKTRLEPDTQVHSCGDPAYYQNQNGQSLPVAYYTRSGLTYKRKDGHWYFHVVAYDGSKFWVTSNDSDSQNDAAISSGLFQPCPKPDDE